MPRDQLKVLVDQFRQYVHYDYIVPTKHSLMYGQVQSGKTGKIMSYITGYKPEIPKVLMVPNNLFMLKQYIKTLTQKNISYKIMDSNTCTSTFNNEQVLITMNNTCRKNALNKYMQKNNTCIKKYSVILDECDQYIHKLKKSTLLDAAKHVLHVTATPFKYTKMQIKMDHIFALKARENYIGINDIHFKETYISKKATGYEGLVFHYILDVIRTDFIRVADSIMLITCFQKIVQMMDAGVAFSRRHPTIPVVVISSNIYIYKNGSIDKTIKNKNVQHLFDMFSGHIILIANRLSNRGINYTNSTYTRNITHQISISSKNFTSFIQKCRVLGTRPTEHIKPTLYCISDEFNYRDRLMRQINCIVHNLENPIQKEKNVSVVALKALCREHKIKGYSKLRKHQIIELLQQNNINPFIA